MASFSLILILIRLSLVAALLTASFCQLKAIGIREVVDDAVGEQREFDYFNFALQWPGTQCQHTRHCCPSNGCCRGSNAPTEFTIHGLWPDYNDGTWPSCCKKSKFDEKEISTLLDTLEKYWPSYRCGSTSTCYSGEGLFWAHERVLNEAGYLPSNTEKYPLGGIVSAIQNAFHATPKLDCSKDAVNELHLCFYKDFKPRDCIIERSPENDNYFSSSSCPKYVSLPVYTSSGVDDATAAIPWILENEPL
ncbi:Ribonuclease 2 [Citrus sinensis]|nr:Ribonuclease 2 [Citrus sinensis]